MTRFSDIDLSFKQLTPVDGYQSQPLVSIDEALQPLQTQIENLPFHITTAKENCHFPSEHQLTRDESASIYIYSMESVAQTLSRALNQALTNENRQALTIWFLYLKLFMTALEKLPTVKGTFWRGVSKDLGTSFRRDQQFTWWNMASCTRSVKMMDGFLVHGSRITMFMIETSSGRDISRYTEYQDEEEVILPMGTQFRVVDDPEISQTGRIVVHLIEISK